MKEKKEEIEYHHIFMNYFHQLGGFDAIINLIFNNLGNGFCNFYLINRILKLVYELYNDFKPLYQSELIVQIKDSIYARLKAVSEKELKELDMTYYKKTLDDLNDFIEKFQNGDLKDEFNFNRENEELLLYLKFIDVSSFDKKMKGINGIKDYVARLDPTMYDSKQQTNKQGLKYFTPRIFIDWILQNKVIENLFTKNHHIEIIKRSSDVLKFIGENRKEFPNYLLDIIWNSMSGKREEDVAGLTGLILEIIPSLPLRAAVYLYQKFLTIDLKAYDEEFVVFLVKFTKEALKLVLHKSRDGSLRLTRVEDDLRKFQFFGVELVYEYCLDTSPLPNSLSHNMLEGLKYLISEYPTPRMLNKILENCAQNIRDGKSVYQSIIILLTYYDNLSKLHNWDEFCQITCERFEEKHDIIEYLVEDLTKYCSRVKKMLGNTNSEAMIIEAKNLGDTFVGRYDHIKNIEYRLKGIAHFGSHIYMKRTLNTAQFEKIWKALVLNYNFPFERSIFISLCFNYTFQPRNFIHPHAMRNVFENILCNDEMMNFQHISEEKFKLFENYFLNVNNEAGNIKMNKREGSYYSSECIERLKNEIIGMKTIWRLLIECPNPDIIDKVVTLLVNVNFLLCSELKNDENFFLELIKTLMIEIENLKNQSDLHKIGRLILFLSRYLDKFRRSFPSYTRHVEAQNPINKVKLEILFEPYHKTKTIEVSTKDKIGFLVEKIRLIYSLEFDQYKMTFDKIEILANYFENEVCQFPKDGKITIEKIETEVKPPELYLVSNEAYLQIFLDIFEKWNPGNEFYFLFIFRRIF